MDSLPLVRPVLFSGTNLDIKNNWQFVGEDDKVVTTFSKTATVIENDRYSVEKHVKAPWVCGKANLLAVTLEKDFVAVAFRGRPATINMFSLLNRKDKRTMMNALQRCRASEFVSLAFTADGAILCAALGAPDWLFMTFQSSTGLILSYSKAVYNLKIENIKFLATNNYDASSILLCGRNLFRQMAIRKGRWDDFGYQCRDRVTFTSGCWLSLREAIGGTTDGRLVILCPTKLLKALFVHETKEITLPEGPYKAKVEESIILRTIPHEDRQTELKIVDNLTAYKHAFAFSYGKNEIFVFQMANPRCWRLTDLLKLSVDCKYNYSISLSAPKFTGISFNYSVGKVIVSQTDGRSFVGKIGNIYTDPIYIHHVSLLSLYGPSINHTDEIRDVKTCTWKPIFITVGTSDRICKVWDYNLKTLLFSTHFKFGIFSVSIHPLGIFVLLGLRHFLEMCILGFDGFKRYQCFESKKCRISSFSEDGTLFAFTRETFIENDVHIYSTTTLTCIHIFKNIILLEGGDLKILKATHLVNEFNGLYPTTQDISELSTEKTFSLTENEVPSKKTNNITLIKDDYIVEFEYDKEKLNYSFMRECPHPIFKVRITAAYTSKLRHYLVLGFTDGRIIVLTKPHTDPLRWCLLNMHSKAIIKIQISRNDTYMLTSDCTGVVIIWRIGNLFKDKKNLLNLPYSLLDKHFLADVDFAAPKESTDFLRYNFPLVKGDNADKFFRHRIGTYVFKPIKEHYDYIMEEFKRRQKTREMTRQIYEKQKMYQDTLHLKALSFKLLGLMRKRPNQMIKQLLLMKDYKKEIAEKEKVQKQNFNCLLHSARCFSQFFAYSKEIFNSYHDLFTSRWARGKIRLQELQHQHVRVGETLNRLVYQELKKEFKAKMSVLTKLECYIKSQMGVIVFLKRQLINRKIYELDWLEKELAEYIYILGMSEEIINSHEIVYMKQKLLSSIELFKANKRKVVAQCMQTIVDEFHLRQQFVNFKPEYSSIKLKHADAVLDSAWLKEWQIFKQIFNDYMLMTLIYADITSLRNKILASRQKSKRLRTYKKQSSKIYRPNQNQAFNDQMFLTKSEVRNKNDQFYNILESAISLNADTSIDNTFLTKLLVLTSFKAKNFPANDLIYNIETYDICMKLINEQHRKVDQRVGIKKKIS